ncbi:UbiA family prenyltransferase [Roseinatronobacter bogoriensis]|uniref:Manganese transporter permease n=1 Tax=Roseinatronobacter bogoriensis subsp. barguzinensis TaxID=441209 RepID=A0A2K8KJ93_9RHOB|nr:MULTISPECIES: UbiA family prenyltransferase [Rhodobaca]ATX66958.1 manganese transporter permease [Rhodobaca barguzinensis]MBB4206448.1 4-hydroxybenzoate polyprenyltransferase [Rhodobaca bogoriensis DSM 18756]TDW41192.1 4-hydroxybenzoate polyprenyltransferase [Rhodobaca barguzinensis]TDY74630.1 4-hydroxybenzoate polyprenyltransferase [Rhodobaca bogoriensis DSM 18756]
MIPAALWTYQKERFPLVRTVPLLAVFSAASISVSAEMAGRPLPGWGAFAAGFAVAMLLFFQMRVCDEYKDLEDDKRYRPDRPIPRGLISLRAVLSLGLASLPLTAFAAWAWHPPLIWLLGGVWLWLAAMTAEFGAPEWLKARPVLYLLSHMAIMPLIDLLLTAMEWLPAGGPAFWLWLFLALSFVNGCVLEIGRKLWAPQSEIAGVESYSGLWGPKKGALIWAACVALSWGLLVGVGAATGVVWVAVLLGGAGALWCIRAAAAYAAAPTIAAQKRLDMAAGLWVFACYALAGFAPLIVRMF